MKKVVNWTVLALAVLLIGSVTAFAQDNNGGGGGNAGADNGAAAGGGGGNAGGDNGGGGGAWQMPPGMQAWMDWMKSHPNIAAVGQTLRALGRLERSDSTTPLSKAAAKAELAILTAWKSKPVMTDAQAKIVNAKLKAPLSAAELAIVNAPRRGFGGGGRFGGGGGGGGWGGGGGGGGRAWGGGGNGGGGGGGGGWGGGGGGGFTFPAPKDYNPLNPSTNPMTRMRTRMQEQYDTLVAALKTTAG